MDSSTKESLYSLLNLIDYLESVSFISLDVNKVNQIRESIFSVINSNNNVKKISSGNEYQRPHAFSPGALRLPVLAGYVRHCGR